MPAVSRSCVATTSTLRQNWAPYLDRVPSANRLAVPGGPVGGFQRFRTVAGMVAVITSVLAGSTAGLLAAVSSDHSAVIGFVVGGAVAAAALVAMMRYQHSAWRQQMAAAPFSASDEP